MLCPCGFESELSEILFPLQKKNRKTQNLKKTRLLTQKEIFTKAQRDKNQRQVSGNT